MTSKESPSELAVSDAPVTFKTMVMLAGLPSTPEAYQNNPAGMWAASLQGRELGIGPMTSINNIDVIDGTISMRAKLMSALIHRGGHIIKVTEQSTERAAFTCFRYHRQTNTLIEVGDLEYTLADAELAGDVKKPTYKKHPKAMLTNRLLTLAGRTFYGDCLAGIGYTADEIGLSDEVDPIPIELEFDEQHLTPEEFIEAVEA